MNLKQTTLAVSVMAALVVTNANAAISIGGGYDKGSDANTPVQFAVEQNAETNGKVVSLAGDLAIKIPSVAGYTVNASSPLYFTINLEGGVKFAAAPKLVCQTTAATPIDATNQSPNKASGASSVDFTVAVNNRMNTASNAYCTLIVSGATIADDQTAYYVVSDKTDKTISVLVSYTDTLQSKTATYSGKFISFVQAFTSVIKADNASAKIDVKSASKKFENGSLREKIGTIKYSATPSVRFRDVSAGAPTVAASAIINTALITVTGPAVNAAQSISLYNGGCTGTIVGAAATPSNGSAVIALKSSIDSLEDNALDICMVLSGTNEVEAGQLQAQLSGVNKSGFTSNFGSVSDILDLKKNGKSFRVLNIPGSTSGDKAFVRLYNPNNFKTIVRGTMYNSEGVQIGTTQILDIPTDPATTPTPLNANEVRVFNATHLEKLFNGGSAFTGRVRLLIDAEADIFRVQALLRGGSTGVLVNMSSETEADAN